MIKFVCGVVVGYVACLWLSYLDFSDGTSGITEAGEGSV